jgi:glycosyltransferase involved in cell wall biosynthesis
VRICFLDQALFVGGADAVNGARVQSLALARDLTARGHEVLFSCGRGRKETGPVPRECEGVQVMTFPVSSRVPVFGLPAAVRAVRDLQVDVVYVRGRSALAGVAAWERWRRGTGFVWASNAEEGCERWKHVRHLWSGPRPLTRRLLRTPVDFATDVVCDWGVSRADRHVCQTRYQCDRLRLVHGREGVVIRSLQTVPPTLPRRVTPPLVAWVGRVSVERGPEDFVRLAAALAGLDCDFAMVGPASSAGYLEGVLEESKGLARFRYVGMVPLAESWDWIARATVLVNTSPEEGISNALVQAWHCGTPTVALHFDPDGIIEENGVGYCSGRPDIMAEQVRRLVTDKTLHASMRAKALALARSDFSSESVGPAYEQIMRQAVEAHV